LLANEFCFEELQSECLKVLPDRILSLSERVSKLEERIESQEMRLESLCLEVEKLKQPQTRIESQETALDGLGGVTLSPELEEQSARLSPDILLPVKEADPPEGIISILTRKCGGNVHEKGIVTITSMSITDAGADGPNPANVVDLDSDSDFWPGRWIQWDFHNMRVRLTHYTIKGWGLKSWVVEGSLDGENWTEIDNIKDNHDFDGQGVHKVSFYVSKDVECHCIQLTITGRRIIQKKNDNVGLVAVEFFGTLHE
jgi:hypothetical protein